ncbi:MAG: hypothetical protein ACMUJM_07530 [bacterium]
MTSLRAFFKNLFLILIVMLPYVFYPFHCKAQLFPLFNNPYNVPSLQQFPLTTSLPFSNSSFFIPTVSTVSQPAVTSFYYPSQTTSSPYYNNSNFYVPLASTSATISGSYTPFSSSTGYYNPSITASSVYSPAATSYYLPPLSINTATPPQPITPLSASNPYIVNASYLPAAGIPLDLNGDYTGEWESILRNEDGDIKRCTIEQIGINLTGDINLQNFIISTSGLSDFTGTISGATVTLEIELADDVIAVLIGEVAIGLDGNIIITGTYTVIGLYSTSTIDQGTFILEGGASFGSGSGGGGGGGEGGCDD